MGALVPGEKVLVPTEVKSGPFPGEKLVTVSTNRGQVSGFAKADYLFDLEGATYLLAEVKRAVEGNLTVRLYGSFFTTTGVADIRTSVARRKTPNDPIAKKYSKAREG